MHDWIMKDHLPDKMMREIILLTAEAAGYRIGSRCRIEGPDLDYPWLHADGKAVDDTKRGPDRRGKENITVYNTPEELLKALQEEVKEVMNAESTS